jgi:hypothetical protein
VYVGHKSFFGYRQHNYINVYFNYNSNMFALHVLATRHLWVLRYMERHWHILPIHYVNNNFSFYVPCIWSPEDGELPKHVVQTFYYCNWNKHLYSCIDGIQKTLMLVDILLFTKDAQKKGMACIKVLCSPGWADTEKICTFNFFKF